MPCMISTLQVIFLSDALVLRKAFFSNSLETVENKRYNLAEVWIMTREEKLTYDVHIYPLQVFKNMSFY